VVMTNTRQEIKTGFLEFMSLFLLI
jgi:hypothetical protein